MNEDQNAEAMVVAMRLLLMRAKMVAGLLAKAACLASGMKPEHIEDYERADVRIDYGEPTPDERMAEDGSTIYRRAIVVVMDTYLFAEVQVIYKPGANKLTLRGIVGDIALAEEVDPGNQLAVEWIERRDLVDSRPRLY